MKIEQAAKDNNDSDDTKEMDPAQGARQINLLNHD